MGTEGDGLVIDYYAFQPNPKRSTLQVCGNHFVAGNNLVLSLRRSKYVNLIMRTTP